MARASGPKSFRSPWMSWSKLDLPIQIKLGGLIGTEADTGDGRTLTDEVQEFCRSIFQGNGAVLAGSRRWPICLRLSPCVWLEL